LIGGLCDWALPGIMCRLESLWRRVMIGYVTLGTNDLARATKFYDALLAEIGGKRAMESDRFVSWSAGPNSPGLGVIKPFNGKAATVGNGAMVALVVDSQEKVKALYNKALQLGAKDEGAPGLRLGTFYAAYFRDLDGNKLNAFYFAG
jgi:catechol 2,3-dioxygenase-like lactoylglutathione lyase family enzyme